ncbi:MAG TPA: hypothetical protein VNX21_05560 [Candidatus Thermoplasmatota archaeon]|nr:hypothetical protein [Candidatus Thermoplasmatota archaeon]
MLHIVNGDATLRLLAQAGLDGEYAIWRDALMEGPAPNGLRSRADWEERAARNATDWGISRDAYLAGVDEFHARLEKGDAEEVVLWFEEDLFCQLPLCYLLSLRRPDDATPWSVVCHEDRLGEQSPDKLRLFFEARGRPTPGFVDLARRAWAAYGAADPSGLAALAAEEDFAAWPLLRRGLLAHLARFPGARNGLNAPEEAILQALRPRPLAFPDLHAKLAALETFRTYGAGDMQVASLLHDLAGGPVPLVTLAGAARRDDVLERVRDATLAVTTAGRAVLAGEKDHVKLNPPDRWLGGVHHAPGRPLWRWDAAAGQLVREDA